MRSSDDQLLCNALQFRDLVEAFHLHGLLFQHVELCERRAWLHMNRIDYSHLDKRMQLGAISHDLHKTRDRSVEGLIGISPDRVNWKSHKVIETKGSAGARRAVSCQTRFYALMLTAATGHLWAAENEIIGKKKAINVSLSLDDADVMITMARRLGQIAEMITAPRAERKAICTSCSYRYLCGYV